MIETYYYLHFPLVPLVHPILSDPFAQEDLNKYVLEEKEQGVTLSPLWERKSHKTFEDFLILPGRPGKPLSPAKHRYLVAGSNL